MQGKLLFSQNNKFLRISHGVTFGVVFISTLWVFVPAAFGATGINQTIHFQGKLTDKNGLNVADTNYSVVFTLYDASSGGTNLWTETQSVTTKDGLFQVNLNSVNNNWNLVNFNTDNLYLGIKVGTDAEMTPRIRFASVPYALNAQKVAGLTVTNTTGTLTVPNGKTISFGGAFSTSGTNDVAFTTSGATTLVLPTTGTLATLAGLETLTNKTIGSTGLTFSGAATDITTGVNEDLLFTPNGTGELILGADFNSGVDIGSDANTPAVLSVSGGIGKNAAFIVNNTNSGDILSASSSGTQRFSVTNAGGIRLGTSEGVANECLLSGGPGTAATWGSCGSDTSRKYAAKSANQSVTNSTVLTDDTALQFTIGPNETWIVRYSLLVTNNNSATPDFKAAVDTVGSSTCRVTLSGAEPAGAAFPQSTSTNCTTPTAMVNNTIVADVNVPFQAEVQGVITDTSGATNTVKLQFAENAAGTGTSITIMAGSYVVAYKATGADLAETYYTHDASIQPGNVVSLDPTLSAGVQKSAKPYDTHALGIISTQPGLVLSDASVADGIPVQLALSGRVPVKVSTESGVIQPGDYLTTSSTPGVAMKATKPGIALGQALTGFDGPAQGTVIIFIKNMFVQGEAVSLPAAGLTYVQPAVSISPQNNVPDLTTLFSTTSADTRNAVSSETGHASSAAEMQIQHLAQLKETLGSLSVSGNATVSGNLRVQGNSLIEGILNVVDVLTANNLIVNRVADFFGDVIFRGDVSFRGTPTFNNDTAGTAVIRKDQDRVVVAFEKPFKEPPVVSASIVLGEITKSPDQSTEQREEAQGKREQQILADSFTYLVTRRTQKGFIILLNKPASEDITFSWTAFYTEKNQKNMSQESSQVPTILPTKQEDRLEPTKPLHNSAGQEGGDENGTY